MVNKTSVFEDDGIKVFLEWMAESSAGVTYNVSIIPQVPITKVSGASAELKVSYNTSYHLTVLATLCEQNSANLTLEVHFGECSVLIISKSRLGKEC